MTHVCRVGYVVFVVASVCGLRVDAQSPLREQLIALGAHVDVRSTSYTVRTSDATVVFTGDPIRVVVSVGNNTHQPVRLAFGPQVWTQGVRFAISRLDVNRFAALAIRTDTERAGPAALTLDPGRSAGALFRTVMSERGDHAPGTYRIEVSLDPEAITPRPNDGSILKRELVVELREPSTTPELVDQYLQRAYRARTEGRFDEVRRWANEALILNANSLPAILDIADSWVRDRNCPAALPLYERALSLATTNGDVDLVGVTGAQLIPAIQGGSIRCKG